MLHKKRTAFFALCFLMNGICTLSAQTPSQKEQLRILVWADLDAYPGFFGDEAAPVLEGENKVLDAAALDKDSRQSEIQEVFGFAIGRTKEIAPYLLEGMLNGWKFEYTPSDKARKVSEYWNMESITDFNISGNKIEYRDPMVREDRLLCWVYCDRTPQQVKDYEYWTSISHPHIHGKGTGLVQDGFEGIKKACSQALKNAVRDYWRTIIKNKPKEICGTVLLIRDPRVYIKDGQYVVDLDFFLQTDRIITYSMY